MSQEQTIRDWADSLVVTGEFVTKASVESLINRLRNKPKRIYISGPMTGLPNHNKEAFDAAALTLRRQGNYVFNPAENDNGNVDHPRKLYLRPDIMAVLQADEVVVLPGWDHSAGAKLEVLMAQELDIPITVFGTREPLKHRAFTLVSEPDDEDVDIYPPAEDA